MGVLSHFDEPCPVCDRPCGDHTLREWSACFSEPTTDVPYKATPEDMASAAAAGVRARFQLDPDLIVADHIVMHAATLAGSSGSVDVTVPAILHEFQIGVLGSPPVTVAKIAYVGSAGTIRGYGRLARDTANGAANAAERAA